MPASFGLWSDLNKIYSYEWEWCKGIAKVYYDVNLIRGNFDIIFSIISDMYKYLKNNLITTN